MKLVIFLFLILISVTQVEAVTKISELNTADISDVTTDFAGGELVFNYNSQEVFRLTPTFVINGNERDLNWVKTQFPNVNYRERVDHKELIKFGFNLSGVSSAQLNAVDEIRWILTQNAINWQNVEIIDVDRDSIVENPETGEEESFYKRQIQLVFPNGLIWDFQDLIDSGFTLNLNKSSRTLSISNLSAGYDSDSQSLYLDPTTQSSCGTLNTAGETYELDQDLHSSGTCLTVSANNITIDGKGYSLNYGNLSDFSHGINIGSVENITIKNFGNINLANESVVDSNGVYVNGGTNIQFINNTFTTNGLETSNNARQRSIFFDFAGDNSIVVNNTFTTVGRDGSGVYLNDGHDILIHNNIFHGNNRDTGALTFNGQFDTPERTNVTNNYFNITSLNGFAISMSKALYARVENNDLEGDDTSDSIINAGTGSVNQHNYNLFKGNNISNNDPQADGYAIRVFRDAYYNNYTENYIYSTNTEYLILFSHISSDFPQFNLFWNNTFNSSSNNFISTSDANSVPNYFNNSGIGNFWANTSGTGYSEICTDSEPDGICDTELVLAGGNYTDWFPLTFAPESEAEEIVVTILDPSTANPNTTVTGNIITYTFNVTNSSGFVSNTPTINNLTINGIQAFGTGSDENLTIQNASVANSESSEVTSITIPKPADAEEGDLLLTIITTAEAEDSGTPFNTLSGWTFHETVNASSAVSDPTISVFYKTANSSEPSSYTWDNQGTTTYVTGHVLTVKGADTSDPFFATQKTDYGTGGCGQSPAITGESGKLALFLTVRDSGANLPADITTYVPATTTAIVYANTTNAGGGFGQAFGASFIKLDNSSTTGEQVFTGCSNDEYAGISLVINPSSTGTSYTPLQESEKWLLNVTAPSNADGTYNTILNITSIELTVTDTNVSNIIYLTAAAGDTCTYSGSGEWFIECSDNCVISTSYDIGGNRLYHNGSGRIIYEDRVYNYSNRIDGPQCSVIENAQMG